MCRSALVGMLAIAPLTFGACGDTGDEASADVQLVEGEARVQALDNTFRPENIEVPAGTTVVWQNVGRTAHDVAPAEGDAYGVGKATFVPGDGYSHRFTEPGTYDYYCTLHGTPDAGMIGTVTVTAG
jgi:plastocyanin